MTEKNFLNVSFDKKLQFLCRRKYLGIILEHIVKHRNFTISLPFYNFLNLLVLMLKLELLSDICVIPSLSGKRGNLSLLQKKSIWNLFKDKIVFIMMMISNFKFPSLLPLWSHHHHFKSNRKKHHTIEKKRKRWDILNRVNLWYHRGNV